MWTTIEVRTRSRVEVVDVTDQVAAALNGQADGLAAVCCRHTTAALTLNENEGRLHRDLLAWLEEAVPADRPYAHNAVDDNAAAHLRAMLLGSSVCIPITGGRLALGRWQRILLVELDGPRTRSLLVGVTAAPPRR